MDYEKVADNIFKSVESRIALATAPLHLKIAELEKRLSFDGPLIARIAELEARDVSEAVAKAVAAIPVPKDGKDCDMAAVKSMVDEAVKLIPTPKDGKDADPEQIAVMVKSAVDAIPRPKDGEPGKNPSPEEVAPMIRAEVEKAVAALPKPRDGVDGRDALDIDILPEVIPGKSYRHKTFARWRGGLIRAVRNTDPLMPGDDDVLEHGWSIVVNGVDAPVDKGLFDNFSKSFEAALND